MHPELQKEGGLGVYTCESSAFNDSGNHRCGIDYFIGRILSSKRRRGPDTEPCASLPSC